MAGTAMVVCDPAGKSSAAGRLQRRVREGESPGGAVERVGHRRAGDGRRVRDGQHLQLVRLDVRAGRRLLRVEHEGLLVAPPVVVGSPQPQ